MKIFSTLLQSSFIVLVLVNVTQYIFAQENVPDNSKINQENISNEYQVVPGDTLWSISQKYYGNGFLWKIILRANMSAIKLLPNGTQALIVPGQKLTIVKNVDDFDGKNIALNKPIIREKGQVVYLDYDKKYSSKNITDGDENLGWRTETDAVNASYAVIDLGQIYSIKTIAYKIGWDKKPGFDKKIRFAVLTLENSRYIDNIKAWNKLDTRDIPIELNYTWIFVDTKSLKARYVKVEYVHEDEEWGGWGNIQEVKVFGQ